MAFLQFPAQLRGFTMECVLTVAELPGYGLADLTARAWSPPTAHTRFVLGKLRQRYRRYAWGV